MTQITTDIIERYEDLKANALDLMGSYPGSAAWRKEQAALKALAAFEAEHPGVEAAAKAEAEAELRARHGGAIDRKLAWRD